MSDGAENNHSEGGQSQSKVNWGKIGGDILAGAAIAVGIIIVFPVVGEALAPALGAIGSAIGGVFTHGAAMSAATLGTIMAKTFGVALAVGGALHFAKEGEKAEAKEATQDANYQAQADAYDQRSFAAEQDIRKMQALMVSRMQAAGHEPAMAMATTRQR